MIRSRYKRQINHLCPSCLSTMQLTSGEYACTGDRLTIWLEEFKKFDAMELSEKKEYLKELSDQDKFFFMYKQGSKLSCDFSSNLMSDDSITVPDPMVVGKIERSLGRELTEEELEEGKIFYTDGKKYKTKPVLGYFTYKIPRLNYPEDF